MGKKTPGELLPEDVPPFIPEQYRMACFAEAPGAEEMAKGIPLVGASGRIFNRILFHINLRRRYVKIDNFCRTKLPNNRTDYLWSVTKTGRFNTHPDWDELVERFKESVMSSECRLIVLLGNTPLVALFGPEYRHIDSIRGYHLWLEDKLIMPTNHPAKCLPGRTPAAFWLIYADILKGFRILERGAEAPPIDAYIPGRGWQTVNL